MATKGASYVATGERFIEEALVSAGSFKAMHPEIPCVLWTDQVEHQKLRGIEGPFDAIKSMRSPCYGFADTIYSPEMLVFDYNLFIDTDTFITGKISGVLDMLANVDVVARLSPGRGLVESVPDAVCELNTGVVGLRDSAEVRYFLNRWREDFERTKGQHNQPSFARELYNSNLRFWPLPPEFNIRTRQATYIDGQARVIHGRETNLPKLAERINKNPRPRIVWNIPLADRWTPTLVLPAPRAKILNRVRKILRSRLPSLRFKTR